LEHLHFFHTWSCLLPSKYKEVFKEFPKTEDAKTLKQHQRFFLVCIILIIVDDINVKVNPSHVLVFFGDLMDGLGPIFSPTNTACMLTASNKSSNNTVMKESVLEIVLLNDTSLELAISFLTAS
jgi:hypothetical protein